METYRHTPAPEKHPALDNLQNRENYGKDIEIGAKDFVQKALNYITTQPNGGKDNIVVQQFKELQFIAEKGGDGRLVKDFLEKHSDTFGDNVDRVQAVVDIINDTTNDQRKH